MRRLTFLRALDELDEASLLVSDGTWQRSLATVEGSPEQQLDQMARSVEERLERRNGIKIASSYRSPWPSVRSWLLPLVFLLGIGANYLGPGGNVSILLNAFVATLLWHLTVYAVMIVRALFRKPLLGGFLARLVSEGANRLAKLSSWTGLESRSLLLAARLRMTRSWLEDHAVLENARARVLMHAMAISFATGIVIGSYLRGIAASYDFVWASTFIDDPDRARTFLEIVFYPVVLATRLLFGWDGVPPLEGENGALWIHFFATACVLVILVPRAILAITAQQTIRRELRGLSFPLGSAWALRRLAPLAGRNLEPVIMAYSYTLEALRKENLGRLTRSVWGERSATAVHRRLEWGTEETLQGEFEVAVLVFNGVQTPEDEVHGIVVQRLAERTKALLVVVDGADVPEKMLEERRTAWGEVIRDYLWYDTSQRPVDAVVTRAATLLEGTT